MTDQIYFSVAIVLWIIALIVITIQYSTNDSMNSTDLLSRYLLSSLAFVWILVAVYGIIWSIGKSIRLIKKK